MKERVVWVDLLRIAAMLSVVMLHVLSKGIGALEAATLEWEIYNAGRCLVKWGVPVFVMISGIFLLQKKETTGLEMERRIGHIAGVLVFWLCFYAGLHLINQWIHGNEIDKKALQSAAEILVFGATHLWYLYMLLGLYLVLPILRKLTEKRMLEYFLAIFVVMNIAIPVIQNIEWQFAEELMRFLNMFQIKTFTGFPGYLLLGYYLYSYDISKYLKKLIYMVGILAFPLSIYLTHIHQGNYFFTDGNFSVVNFSTSVFFFLLFKEKISKINWNKRQIQYTNKLSSISLGIYLIHVAVLGYVNDAVKVLNIGACGKITLSFVITLGISIVLCVLLRKIPFVKRFV